MSARWSVDDYTAAFRRLLPRGRAWPDDVSSVFMRVLKALVGVYAQADADAVDLVTDAFPIAPVHLLPEWEASLGLPDLCAGPDATIEQRQAAVFARFTAGGGLSRQRYIDYAAALGFTIVIDGYKPFRAGHSTAGDPCASDAWAFVWSVRITDNTSGLDPSVLLCELNRIKPAETTIILLT